MIPKSLKAKLPPGLDKDLQEEFAAAVKIYATDHKWRQIFMLIAKYSPDARIKALEMLENEHFLTDDLSKRFVIKLFNGDLADKLSNCIEVYDQEPW